MKISIIVPIYNVEQYIKECFESIASQTYQGEIECIFVDDCGQDNSVAILKQLLSGYHGAIKFTLLQHEHNKGLSGARNTGISYASGDYLYFLDSDDTITLDCIEKLELLVEKYSGVELVQGSVLNPQPWLDLNGIDFPSFSKDFGWIKTHLLQNCCIPITAWNKLVKTDMIKNNHLFFTCGLIHEDELWCFELSKYVSSIAFCFSPTYKYRKNPTGIMNGGKSTHLSYSPILTQMAKFVSSPFPVWEIQRVADIVKEHEPYLKIEDYCKYIRFNKNIVLALLKNRDIMLHSKKKSYTGIKSRIVYRLLSFVINKFYPRHE